MKLGLRLKTLELDNVSSNRLDVSLLKALLASQSETLEELTLDDKSVSILEQ
jgi:hypothetical protein